ncbi:MAG: hypothetical protein ACK4N4_13230 [Burkholderiales bacterium]
MTPRHTPRILIAAAGKQNWLQRIVVFVLAIAIVALAFFFLTVALLAAALLATIVALRRWWLARNLRAAATRTTFEGEYTVIGYSGRLPSPPSRDEPQ